MWFGTRDGLNRYDGYHIVSFRNNPIDNHSISDNFIHCLYTDHAGFLWIGTSNGLNRFDAKHNQFEQFPIKSERFHSQKIYALNEDQQHKLWIATSDGLYNLDEKRQKVRSYRHEPGNQNSIPDERVFALYHDTQGHLWIGTQSGICFFDENSGTFKTLPLPYIDPSGDLSINSILQDRRGQIWIGTSSQGILVVNKTGQLIHRYSQQEHHTKQLPSDQVRAILQDHFGNIWVGCINGGLNLYDEKNNGFFHYSFEAGNLSSLSQRTVSSLCEDSQGNIWIGTHRGGVNLISPGARKFTWFQQEYRQNSLSYNDVKTFCEDKNGNIWIGTDGGGMDRFEPNHHQFTHYRNQPNIQNCLNSDAVLHLFRDSSNIIWISTWGGGLNRFDPQSGKFSHYLHQAGNPSSISSNYVQQVLRDHNGRFWVATYYGGLNIFDPATGKFSRFLGVDGSNENLTGNNVVSMAEDAHGQLWIGTDDGGLNAYDPKTGRIEHYFHNDIKKPDIRVIFTDKQKRLWVGQKGLYLYHEKEHAFKSYGQNAGLDQEYIKGIVQDKQGNLWISTSKGITKFNPQTSQYRKFNSNDGLQGYEFEANACLVGRDGTFYFGGINGFNTFHPEHMPINKQAPPVYLTSFQLFNREITPDEKDSPLQQDISMTPTIELNYQQSSIAFVYAALNYIASANNSYRYMLKGFDRSWSKVASQWQASYTNLSPGNYQFKVQAANNDGIWNKKGTSINIIIHPPFWGTWWFRLGTVLLVAAIAGSLIYFKHHIEIQKLEERKQTEIYQTQLQFFTNISHEFRTPLSLIAGPIEELVQQEQRPNVLQNYQLIQRNAHRLIRLVNELMDFRKVEEGSLKLRATNGNFSRFVQEICEEFSVLAQQKRITFNISAGHFPTIYFDREVMEKILLNLLDNAFKYTPKGGKVTVNIYSELHQFKPSFSNELTVKSAYKAKRYIHLHVVDTGIGISAPSIQHLFERYYRTSEYHLGSGIGLAFVKSLVLLHKGRILVNSERHKGTEFLISIPSLQEDFSTSERWESGQENIGQHLESIVLPTLAAEEVSFLPTHITSETASDPSKPHLLLVEDHLELRTFLKNKLSERFYIVEAGNGKEGLAILEEHLPDIIVSDVMMPEMNGYVFCEAVKSRESTLHIPFIMLTAKNAADATVEGLRCGADFYFPKPVQMEVLQLTLDNLVKQRREIARHVIAQQNAVWNETARNTKDKAFMDNLYSIIKQSMSDPALDVDHLCKETGMSRTLLYQKIKLLTGHSIGDLIRSVRLKSAAEMLAKEDLPITEVMYLVGIQTQSYFTRAFKKEFGKTPSKYLLDLKNTNRH